MELNSCIEVENLIYMYGRFGLSNPNKLAFYYFHALGEIDLKQISHFSTFSRPSSCGPNSLTYLSKFLALKRMQMIWARDQNRTFIFGSCDKIYPSMNACVQKFDGMTSFFGKAYWLIIANLLVLK
jgi:hypothetical protein